MVPLTHDLGVVVGVVPIEVGVLDSPTDDSCDLERSTLNTKSALQVLLLLSLSLPLQTLSSLLRV